VRKKVKKGVGGGEAESNYCAVGSVTISIFWNVILEGELPRRGTCENSGWMKDLYWYRKGAIRWRASEGRSNRADSMTTVQLGAEVREDWFGRKLQLRIFNKNGVLNKLVGGRR